MGQDVAFVITDHGYEIWLSDRIANDHPDLVDEFADWLEDEVGVVNLGQIEHKSLVADGVLTDELRFRMVSWWTERVGILD